MSRGLRFLGVVYCGVWRFDPGVPYRRKVCLTERRWTHRRVSSVKKQKMVRTPSPREEDTTLVGRRTEIYGTRR